MTRKRAIRAINASLSEIARLGRSNQATVRRQRTSGVALDDASVQILHSVRDHGPLRLKELAVLVEIEVSQLSKKVRRLVEDGLVTQEIDPDERRAVRLETTAKGRQAYKRYREAADGILAQAFTDWSDDDLAAAAEVLVQVTRTFHGAGSHSSRRSNGSSTNPLRTHRVESSSSPIVRGR